MVIAAWGNDGTYIERSEQFKASLPNLYCLKVSKSGEPTHPLYQPNQNPRQWAYNSHMLKKSSILSIAGRSRSEKQV
ncbi:DUF1643 domain-containing protein [Colwelliaceae bacterium 6471]